MSTTNCQNHRPMAADQHSEGFLVAAHGEEAKQIGISQDGEIAAGRANRRM